MQIWCNEHLQIFQGPQIALALQACAISLSLKHLLVLINTKLLSKSCYYQYWLWWCSDNTVVDFFLLTFILATMVIPITLLIQITSKPGFGWNFFFFWFALTWVQDHHQRSNTWCSCRDSVELHCLHARWSYPKSQLG